MPCCGNPAAASWLLGDPSEVDLVQPFEAVAAVAACWGEATSFSCPAAHLDHPCTCQDAFRTAAVPSYPDACQAVGPWAHRDPLEVASCPAEAPFLWRLEVAAALTIGPSLTEISA